MTRARYCEVSIVAAALAVFATACGNNGNSSTAEPTNTPTRTVTQPPSATTAPTATQTPVQTGSQVTGLVVVNRSVTATGNDALGAPPESWSDGVDGASFNQSLAHADWSVDGVPGMQGLTAADGRFEISGVQPGRHTLQVIKTLDGNILSTPGQTALAIPFSVGSDGNAEVVAEVSWGLVKSISTYTDSGAQVRDIRGPYGSWLVTRAGRVTEFGDPGRTFTDPDGDGRFDVQPCVEQLSECAVGQACADGRFCTCTSRCPACDDCGPGVCAPPGTIAPYPCNPDGTCEQNGDRCVCVASCPDCTDCSRKVCVPDCVSAEIVGLTISNGPAQLVVGRQGQVNAIATLSDGTQFDVTYLADWQSSDPSVASLDSWGVVSALAIGTTNLTATIGTITTAPRTLAVVERPTLQRLVVQNPFCYCGPIPLGGPAVDAAAIPCVFAPPVARTDILPIPSCGNVVQIGSTVQFTATGQFADGSYEDLTKQAQWQVAPTSLGTVVNGLFTADAAGTARVTAAFDGVTSDAVDVRVVTQPTIVALSIYAENSAIAFVDTTAPVRGGVAVPCIAAAPEANLCCCPGPLGADLANPCGCGYSITVLRGDQLNFHATAQYDTGDWQDVTDQVAWRSSNTAAATLDARGVMTAVTAGDATVDAVFEEITSNAVAVHVVNEATLQSMYVTQDGGDRVVAKGDQRFFHATGFYDVGFSRDITNDATWRSSNDSVGGFDTPGVFTGRAVGTVQVWAELGGQQSDKLSLEVFETSALAYCDPNNVNRAVWSDSYNRVTLESDCSAYNEPGVVALRYTVTEIQPHGGIFDPCLDVYVYQGGTRVRTIREEGCGAPFLSAAAPGRDAEALKYQLLAFWDLKDDSGNPVPPGTYTVYGRFYLYYDPVVSIDVSVLAPGEPLPTRKPTATPAVQCTPPLCAAGEVFYCPDRCPGGCGTLCATPTPTLPVGAPVSIEVGSASGAAGDHVKVAVSLHTAGQLVAGVQNDLLSDPQVSVAATANGRPDCTVNPDINKNGTAFAFLGLPCTSGTDCRVIRAVVLSLDSVDPIPDGAQLYTCAVAIAPGTPAGSYRLALSNLVGSSPAGARLPVTGTGGEVIVLAPGSQVPTVTPTPVAEGTCYRGSSACSGSSFFPTAQRTCCDIFRLSASPFAISWCPADKIDSSTGACGLCSDPCDGLVLLPTPTPCDMGPPCPPGQHKICDPTRSCTDLFYCVCEGPPPSPTPPTSPAPEQRVCFPRSYPWNCCESDAQCPNSQCAVVKGLCSYGDFDGFPCRDGGDCPGGYCFATAPVFPCWAG